MLSVVVGFVENGDCLGLKDGMARREWEKVGRDLDSARRVVDASIVCNVIG